MGQPLYLSALVPRQPNAYHRLSLKCVHFIAMLTQLLDVVLLIALVALFSRFSLGRRDALRRQLRQRAVGRPLTLIAIAPHPAPLPARQVHLDSPAWAGRAAWNAGCNARMHVHSAFVCGCRGGDSLGHKIAAQAGYFGSWPFSE